MKTKSKEEITTFFKELFKEERETEIETIFSTDELRVTVSQMYNFVEVDFKKMKAIGEFFETENLNVENDSYPGCETCDYGSSYQMTFVLGV